MGLSFNGRDFKLNLFSIFEEKVDVSQTLGRVDFQ